MFHTVAPLFTWQHHGLAPSQQLFERIIAKSSSAEKHFSEADAARMLAEILGAVARQGSSWARGGRRPAWFGCAGRPVLSLEEARRGEGGRY